MKRILVLGSCGPPGYNFIHSLRLSSERIYIVGTDSNIYHAVGMSPEADVTYLIPRIDSGELVPKINEIIEKEQISFVHAQPDILVEFLSRNRAEISSKTFLPPQKTVEICQDKWKSAQKWLGAKIPCPNTMELNTEDDIHKAFDNLGETLWVRAKHGAGGKGSSLVTNLDTALAWINYWKSREDQSMEFIAQEYLPGDNIAMQSLWKDGELLVSQARSRVEYIYPFLAVSGVTGTPVVAKNIAMDEEFQETAIRTITSIDPKATGIFCADFKGDAENILNPTEINCGRFFTTSSGFTTLGKKLGIKGANMPYIYVQLGYGEEVPDMPSFNVLPPDWFYIRHIDLGNRWIHEEDIKTLKGDGFLAKKN